MIYLLNKEDLSHMQFTIHNAMAASDIHFSILDTHERIYLQLKLNATVDWQVNVLILHKKIKNSIKDTTTETFSTHKTR